MISLTVSVNEQGKIALEGPADREIALRLLSEALRIVLSHQPKPGIEVPDPETATELLKPF